MVDALEVAGKILDLPAILLVDLPALDAAASAFPLLCAQFVHVRGHGKVLEIRDPAPTFTPLHPPLLLHDALLLLIALQLERAYHRLQRFLVIG